MRNKIVVFLKMHPEILQFGWSMARHVLNFFAKFTKIRSKTMIFASFGGRKFDDSPKAIYEEVCRREEFDDWELIWAFVEPDKYEIPRGRKIRIDTWKFFSTLIQSQCWISNSGMDRGIGINRKGIVRVETWHGTPIKKIGSDQNQNTIGGKRRIKDNRRNENIIRCAQSNYDKEIFMRLWNAKSEDFLMCDLPRNDALYRYTKEQIAEIRRAIGISDNKKVILYTPTYREYLIDENKDTFLAPPICWDKWKKELGYDYVLLIRAHYAVTSALKIKEDNFVKDVSDYPVLNDLYIISDMMISDYSSTFIDYSILERPMFCFAYDYEEYKEKRGLYFDLEEVLPCAVDRCEEEIIQRIVNINIEKNTEKTKEFRNRFAPCAGEASKCVVDEIIRRI